MTSISLLLSFMLLISLIAAAEGPPDVEEVVKKVDQLYRSKSSYAEMQMQIITPHWERMLSLEAWAQGMEKTFVVINEPKKEAGTATLRIGNEMWNYLPKAGKVMKVPPSMMMASWMGSDLTNDDLVREFSMLEDYHYELSTMEDVPTDLITIQFIPKEGLPIVWGKIVMAVRQEDYLPVWQKFYDEKDQVMRLMNYRDIKTFGERKIPAVIEVIPQNKEGHKTIVRYLDVEFNAEVDDDVFTLRNLRRRR